MKLGLISLNGTSSQWIADKAKDYFDIVDMINLKKIFTRTTVNGQEIFYNNQLLPDYDCVYIRGSFRYGLLQTAISTVLKDKTYIPLQPQSFNYCHNKFSTLLALHNKRIPIPTTHYAPNVDIAKKILEDVNYPIIIKIPEGTQGKGVMFADSIASARSVLDTLEIFKQPYLIQEYIETGATDTRAIVIGGKICATMRRKAINNEIRSNIHMGGIGENYELDKKTEEIVIKTAKAVGAEICGVDILEGTKTAVIEVNTSPGLKGITKATNKDVAGQIAKYLFEQTKIKTEKFQKKEYSNIIGSLTQEIHGPKKILTNLDINGGKIKLPAIISKIANFNHNQEVSISVKNGQIEIKKYDLGGETNG